MFFKDTIHPGRILNALMKFNQKLGNKGEVVVTDPPQGTPLPETFAGDQDLATFKTVEELATGYKETKTKASTIGSIEQIPEEIRSDPNIAKYKDISELAKGHLETVKLVGRKGVIIPKDDAPQEEKDKFYNSLGRPEKPELYKFTPIEKLHPAIKVTPEGAAAFARLSHKLGLTQGQADGLHAWYMQALSANLAKQDEITITATKDAETRLRTEWGPEFAANLTLAKRIVEKFGGKEAQEAFGDLGNNPAVLKVLAGIGKKMSEDSINHGEFSDLSTTTTDAKQKIDDINKRIMALDQNDPNYPKLIKERKALYDVAYPDGAE